jgi:hypothetical protein
MQVAYFVPSVPVMMLQTLTDEAFDRAFGVATATAFRFVVGNAWSVSCCKRWSSLEVQAHSQASSCTIRACICGHCPDMSTWPARQAAAAEPWQLWVSHR